MNIQTIIELSKTPVGMFQIAVIFIIILCALSILLSILINFILASKNKPKKQKNSIVETGSMFLFFIVYYLLIRLNLGSFAFENISLRIFLIIIGILIIIIGTIFNIAGRLKLGSNWANQIKIYKNQTLVTSGVYKIVRHPLYASLIWIFYGGSIIYLNYLSFLLNTFVFIPFMYYRAKQEEDLLKKEFKNYNRYSLNTGMFFPKLKWFQKKK